MNLKKIIKLNAELRESLNSIARSEAAVPQIEQEMAEHFGSLIDKPPSKQAILVSRKKKTFMSRLNRERDNIHASKIECDVLKHELEKEGQSVKAEITNALNKECGELAAEYDALKKKICNLQYQAQQLLPKLSGLDVALETKRGVAKTFSRQWDSDKINRLLTDPTNDEFDNAGYVIRFLPPDVQTKWQQQQDKRAKQQQQERERSKKKQQELIAYNRKFYDQALAICQGKLPMPDCFKDIYSRNEIPLDILQNYLRNEAEKTNGKQS